MPEIAPATVPRLCLGLPETPARRASFQRQPVQGFRVFDGLRYDPGWIGAALSFRTMARACLDAGAPWAPLKLYYNHGFIRRRLELFKEDYDLRGEAFPLQEWLDRWRPEHGDLMARVTTQIQCGKYFPLRDDALRAHATQIDPNGAFFAIPLETQQRIWPTEEFELARTRVRTAIPETDLFAGIEK